MFRGGPCSFQSQNSHRRASYPLSSTTGAEAPGFSPRSACRSRSWPTPSSHSIDGRGTNGRERAVSSWKSRPGSTPMALTGPSLSCPFASRSSSIPATSAGGCCDGAGTRKPPSRSDLFVVRAMGPGNASCSHGSGELRSRDRSRLALFDLFQDRARHAAGGGEGRPLVVHRPQEGPSAGIDEGHAGELDADRTRAVRERQGLPAPGKLVHPGAGEPSLEHDGHTFGASHVGDPQHLLPYGASTKNEATTKTGKLGFRWRAGSRMITHQRQLPC